MQPSQSDASSAGLPALPIIYFDFGSPYAYLAIERAPAAFGTSVQLEPIALGAVFKLRGWGSWADTDQREARMSEIEARARRYGLPELAWPDGWPNHSLAANRAGVWAGQRDAIAAFTRALFRRQFAQGDDISDVETLRAAAAAVGLDPDELVEAIQRQEIKDALREATDRAWRAGVRGVPSIQVGGAVFYGDDRLEEAAAAQAASRNIS